MKQAETVSIYKDKQFYCAFPSIVRTNSGELIASFRRAPNLAEYEKGAYTHIHPNSNLVLSRSQDNGQTWSEPVQYYAHAMGGSQDPCMTVMSDGSLVVGSYGWRLLTPKTHEEYKDVPQCRGGNYGAPYCFLGGYFLNSTDNGETWNGPFYPPLVEDSERSIPGIDIPMFNRGEFIEGSDGLLYWAAAVNMDQRVLDLMVSEDRGQTWHKRGRIAEDDKVGFNETSLVELANGDLVAFARTFDFDKHGVIVRSKDRGETWEPWQDMGFVGLPFQATRLPDDRIFLNYGYRDEPYGIRARILDPEIKDMNVEEIVIRDDGANGDLGYSWSVVTEDGRLLCVYYINDGDEVRHIAGTFFDL